MAEVEAKRQQRIDASVSSRAIDEKGSSAMEVAPEVLPLVAIVSGSLVPSSDQDPVLPGEDAPRKRRRAQVKFVF